MIRDYHVHKFISLGLDCIVAAFVGQTVHIRTAFIKKLRAG